MDYNKDMKKISGDSVVIETTAQPHPTIFMTVGGATYVARMHFDEVSKMKMDDKLLRLMKKELEKQDV